MELTHVYNAPFSFRYLQLNYEGSAQMLFRDLYNRPQSDFLNAMGHDW